jgi:protein SCO1/2
MAYSAPRTVSTWWTVFLLCASSILFHHCSSKPSQALPYYDSPDFTPYFNGSTVKHTIDTFSFTDQDGRIINNNAVKGKIHVANFFFTWCGSICPAMMDNLKQVQDTYAKDSNVVILSYTVTPWIDSVAKLKTYATARGINSFNWHLLTGNKAAIYNLARKSYFAEESFGYNKDSTEFLHTEHFLLIDKQQHIRGIYNGTLKLEVEQLVRDIALLEKE